MSGAFTTSCALLALIAAAEPTPLAVRTSPAQLQLGVDSGATVTVTAPAGVEAVHLSANHGSVTDLRHVAPGQFEARYVPPSETYPRIAVIAAWGAGAEGTLHGFVVVPLWGQGLATVTTRPNAKVTLRIGARDFGPVSADATGVGAVQVQVPPGTTHALHGSRRIDLGLPPVARLHALAVPATLPADAEAEVTLRIYSVTLAGQLEPADVMLSVPVGTLGPLRRLSPGVAEAPWRVPAMGPMTLQASAWVAGSKAAPVNAQLRVTPGPATTLAASASGAKVAGQREPVRLRVQLTDARGRPAEDEVTWRADFGAVVVSTPTADGAATAQLELPDRFEGRQQARVTATTARGASASVVVPLLAGPPSELRLSEGLTVRARDEASLRGAVLDAYGNPVAALPQASVGDGDVAVVKDESGFVVRFTAPSTRTQKTTEVQVGLGGVVERRALAVEPRPALLTASLKGGYATNFAVVSAPAGALEVGLWTELAGWHLGALLEGGALTTSSATPVDARGAVESQTVFAPVTASLALDLRLPGRVWLRPAAGAGVAGVFHSVRLGAQPEFAERALAAAAQASLQAGMRLGIGGPFLELKGLVVVNPGLTTLQGSLVSFLVMGGYAFELL